MLAGSRGPGAPAPETDEAEEPLFFQMLRFDEARTLKHIFERGGSGAYVTAHRLSLTALRRLREAGAIELLDAPNGGQVRLTQMGCDALPRALKVIAASQSMGAGL